MEWKQEGEVRWLEAELPGARAAFTTRVGGVSRAPFDELNLGLLTGDDADAVGRNRELLAGALGVEPGRVVIGRQVHGSAVADHTAPQSPAPFAEPGGADPPEVDGHRTSELELPALVFVADCLPIAVAGEGSVAMLHGGWRPLAGGLIEAGLEGLGPRAAAVGPGIGPCCYEVGPEVVEAFEALGLGEGVVRDGRLDLPEAARRLLERAGVDRVELAGLCTRCEPELFFSHRRDGSRTGRQAGLCWIAG